MARRRCIGAVSIFLLTFAGSQCWLYYFFPTTIPYPTAMTTYAPVWIPVALILSLFLYRLLRKAGCSRSALRAGGAVAMVALLFQAFSFPAEHTPAFLVAKSLSALRRYPAWIYHGHIGSSDRAEHVAATVKYRDVLPDLVMILRIEEMSGREEMQPDPAKAILERTPEGAAVILLDPPDLHWRREPVLQKILSEGLERDGVSHGGPLPHGRRYLATFLRKPDFGLERRPCDRVLAWLLMRRD